MREYLPNKASIHHAHLGTRGIAPMNQQGERPLGAIDVDDIFLVVSPCRRMAPTITIGTQFHSWQPTAHGKTPLTKERMVQTATAITATGIDAITDPTPVARAKADLQECRRDSRGACPNPADAPPPIHPHR